VFINRAVQPTLRVPGSLVQVSISVNYILVEISLSAVVAILFGLLFIFIGGLIFWQTITFHFSGYVSVFNIMMLRHARKASHAVSCTSSVQGPRGVPRQLAALLGADLLLTGNISGWRCVLSIREGINFVHIIFCTALE